MPPIATVSVVPSRIDLTIINEADVDLVFVFADSGNRAIDITGNSVQFTAKDRYTGDVKLAEFQASNQTYDPLNGKVIFSFGRSEISAIADPSSVTYFVYEVRRVSGQFQYVHMYGRLIIEPTTGVA